MGRKQTTGGRLNLGEPLASELADFCKIHYDAPAINVVRQAVRDHIERRLEESPALKERYEKRRKRRIEGKNAKLTVVQSDDN